MKKEGNIQTQLLDTFLKGEKGRDIFGQWFAYILIANEVKS